MKFLFSILLAFSFAESESEYYFGNSCRDLSSDAKKIYYHQADNYYFKHKITQNKILIESCEELLSFSRNESYEFIQMPCYGRGEETIDGIYLGCIDSTTISDCESIESLNKSKNPKISYINKETILKEIYNSELDSNLFRFELSNNIITTPSYSNVFNDIKSTESLICDEDDFCYCNIIDSEQCRVDLGTPHSHYPESSLIFEENSITANSYYESNSISVFGICDYNGDGYQDVLIQNHHNYNQGSGYSGYTAIFTKKSASSKFELIDKILGIGH